MSDKEEKKSFKENFGTIRDKLDEGYLLTEVIIPLNKKLTVLGTAIPTNKEYHGSTRDAIIKKEDTQKILTISDKPEEEFAKASNYLKLLILGGLGITISIPLIIILLTEKIEFFSKSVDTIIILIFVLLLSIFLFSLGFKEFKLNQVFTSTPVSNIDSMSMGLVKLKGKATQLKGKVLKAPFSGRECVFYVVKVEKENRTHKGRWKPHSLLMEIPIFYIEDKTGRVPIDPRKANMNIEVDFEKNVDSLDKLPKNIKKRIKEEDILSNKNREKITDYKELSLLHKI